MGTLNILIICLTLILITLIVGLAFIYNNFGIKKREFAHKQKMEELRLAKLKEQSEMEELKNELETNIKKSLEQKVSKLVNDKLEATLKERIKTIEQKLSIKTTE